MGYESRIYIINRVEHKRPYCEPWVFAEKIAMVNMCVMDYDFRTLFDKPIDYTIHIEYPIFVNDRFENETDIDCYGEHLKYTTIDKVVKWLESHKVEYRRISPLLGLLKGFNENEWDELQVVHFGY